MLTDFINIRQRAALKRLVAIMQSKSFNNTGKRGAALRAEFIILSVEQELIELIRGFSFFDEFGLCDRTIDTCFEMNDGNAVIFKVIEHTESVDGFEQKLSHYFGGATIAEWQLRYKISQSFNGALVSNVKIDDEDGSIVATVDGTPYVGCGWVEDFGFELPVK